MLRNKEFKFMLLVMGSITITGFVLTFLIDPFIRILILLIPCLLILTAALFTRKRYRDIRRLSDYLRNIYNGNYSLDIRDNMEGELSILKSNIYKVTLILLKQAELLKKEKQQLTDALSDISHQLKTPLTSMMVMSELLSKDDLDPEKRKEFTRTLGQQLERMEWLLTSLLKLSRLDAGTVEFKRERLNAAALVREAVKPLLIPMELKEQRLIIEGEEQASFLGDQNWTQEALINILKNCIEHTGAHGTISITYSENPIYTEILVSDNGVGIDKRELPYIFQRFFRGKNTGKESVGIGLALARSIITGQNGDITVTSRPGAGTAFSIKFHKQVT